jgi:hypothetical protein
MFRSTVVIAVSMLVANFAFAGTTSAPIIIFTPAFQPGNACIPEEVGSGEETKTSKGDSVIAVGVHGANATRCPNPMFPNLATTEKLPPDEERSKPSPRCVPQRAKVGDELMIPSYGRATVVELDAGDGNCAGGVMAKIVGTTMYLASKGATSAGLGLSSAPAYEPTESEVQREYDRLFATNAPVQEYHVRHILLHTQADALAILKQIHSGRSFTDLAAEASIDPGSKKIGGDLGWNVPSSFIEEFSKSMVSLTPSGLVTEPVKTKFGWHVIELLETKMGKDSFPPLSVVKARISARLRSLNSAASTIVPVPAKAVCRKMVVPLVPVTAAAAKAKQTVVAQIRVENGRVTEILKLSGPSEFYAAVTDALKKYECDRLDQSTIAVQSFEF